jgi:DNA-binding transcriptional LysR family regulator
MSEWEAYRWRLTDIFSSEGLPLRIALEASNPMALIGLVAAGLGVSIYPRSLVEFISESVAFLPIDDPRFRLETILAWKRRQLSETVRSFVALARDYVRASRN